MRRSKELARKSIHFLGLLYIPSLFYLDRFILWSIVLSLTAFAFFLEILRLKNKINLELIREHEKRRFAGYFYTGLAFSLITLLPTNACVVAACCAFGGDGISGIVKQFEKRLSAPSFIVVSFSLSVSFGTSWFPSLVATVLSCLADGKKFDDNFTIPIIAGLSYLIVDSFF
uniref:Dolichol kinase n=1 Tax=Geoglobus ahangari TaxID=113653 RepID=A0A7C3UK55_9EURY